MKCPSPVTVKDPRPWKNNYISVPCGKCGACRKNRRASWTFRLSKECGYSKNSFFITLTYNDEELPTVGRHSTLRKKDWQNFIKRLRQWNKKKGWNNLRYYGVGEYGTKTNRPHYHSILFNVHPDIFKELDKIWPFGHNKIDLINKARLHYVTKYHVNPAKDDNGREEEFATMSKNPGIGHGYIEENKQWHKENKFTHVRLNGFPQKLPRYLKEKIFTEEELKELNAISKKETEQEYEKKIKKYQKWGVKNPIKKASKDELIKARNVRKKSLNQGDVF